jgi:hypothetical protein
MMVKYVEGNGNCMKEENLWFWKDKIKREKREILCKIWISEKVSGPKNDCLMFAFILAYSLSFQYISQCNGPGSRRS